MSESNVRQRFSKAIPHDYENHWTYQQYLPDALKNMKYYEWGDNKTEQAAKAYWEKIKGREL